MIDRRTALAGFGAVAGALALPAMAAAPKAVRKPSRLREGDTVGLIEPAGFTADSFSLDEIVAGIRAMGLVPKVAPHVMQRSGYLAGSDADRPRLAST